jgi:hypothetical protein
MNVRAKQQLSKECQKRPFLGRINRTVKNQRNFNKTIPETYPKNKVSILAPL